MADAVKIYHDAGNVSNIVSGIKAVSVRRTLNAPATCTIVLNNSAGKRANNISRGDGVRVSAFPTKRSTSKTLFVFYGYVSNVEEDPQNFTIYCVDYLGQLGNEILLKNPNTLASGDDAAAVIKEIIAGSNYDLGIDNILGQTRIVLSDGLDLTGRTRLQAIQYIIHQVNITPNKFKIFGYQDAKKIGMLKLPEVEDTTITPFIAGRIPRTSAPLDLYPTTIDRVEEDSDIVNMVTVRNQSAGIEVTVPATVPDNPIHRLFDESEITDEIQAELYGRQILKQQGITKMRWIVEAVPSRFDIDVGDIVEFATVEGGLAGRHMVFDVAWKISPSGANLRLEVGRQSADLLSSIRYASSLSS